MAGKMQLCIQQSKSRTIGNSVVCLLQIIVNKWLIKNDRGIL